MFRNIIGLKITQCASLATCISIVRKYRRSSISEIKSAIEMGDYVLLFDYNDRFGLKKIINCYEDLLAAHIHAQLFEMDDEPTTLVFMKNLNATYDEISDEIDAEEL